MGKGSNPRPVDREVFNREFDRIFGKQRDVLHPNGNLTATQIRALAKPHQGKVP